MSEEKQMDAIGLIRDMDQGNLQYELARRMTEIINAVRESGKKGSLQLTISISPLPKFGANAVEVVPAIKVSVPQPEYKRTIRFITDDLRLIGDNPDQRKFAEAPVGIAAGFGDR